MSSSNLELIAQWKCKGCMFADLKRIEAMKSDPAIEALGNWCTYAFSIIYSRDFKKCTTRKENALWIR